MREPSTQTSCLILIPTYNESQNLPELMKRIFELGLPALEVLIIDDASPDGTGLLAEDLSKRYENRIHVLHRDRKEGLGPAYLAGYTEALARNSQYIVQMDADLSHPPEFLPKLLESAEGCDMAIASRYITGGGVDQSWGIRRRLLSRLGNMYSRIITNMPIRDATSGFRCFHRSVLEYLCQQTIRCRGFGFQIEVTYHVWRQGFRLEEIPFVFAERDSGDSKISMAIIIEAIVRLPQIRLDRKI